MIRHKGIKRVVSMISAYIVIMLAVLIFRAMAIENIVEDGIMKKDGYFVGDEFIEDLNQAEQRAMEEYELKNLELYFVRTSYSVLKNNIEIYASYDSDNQRYELFVDAEIAGLFKIKDIITKINRNTGLILEADEEILYGLGVDSIREKSNAGYFFEHNEKNKQEILIIFGIIILISVILSIFLKSKQEELDDEELQKKVYAWEKKQAKGIGRYYIRELIYIILQNLALVALIYLMDHKKEEYIIQKMIIYFILFSVIAGFRVITSWDKEEREYNKVLKLLEDRKTKNQIL